MTRIEYLINNPTEVEINDLDLLNMEIEKYPYFYSLRAIKLFALKKSNDLSYEDYLPSTAIYSSNRRDLYNFINSSQKITVQQEFQNLDIEKENKIENFIHADKIEIPIDHTNPQEVENLDSIDEKIIENVDSIQIKDENLDNTIQEQIETINYIEDNTVKNSIIENGIEESLENNSEQITEILDFTEENTTENFIMDERLETSIEDNDEIFENSITVAQEFIKNNDEISNAVKETLEMGQEIIHDKIEQVNLIARSLDNNSITSSESKNVFSHTIFQIQNMYDEVRNSPLTEELESNTENLGETVSNNIIHETIIPEIEAIIQPAVIAEENTSVNVFNEQPLPNEVEIEAFPIEHKEVIENKNSFSFNEWLKFPSTIDVDTPTEKDLKFQIIDDFLEKNPKIKPLKKQEIPESKAEVKDIKQTDFSDLMTETLAQIYIEQKQYEKAIKAYKILSLKYPEKYSLFANQIKEIENLKNSK